MSTELSQLGPNGEQQLGINLGSLDGGQKMGINPCPLSSPTTNRGQQLGINPGSLDGGQQMGINPCPYTMGTTNGNQPMSTKFILLGVCSHKNSGQKMGQGLQNLSMLGSHNHNGV